MSTTELYLAACRAYMAAAAPGVGDILADGEALMFAGHDGAARERFSAVLERTVPAVPA